MSQSAFLVPINSHQFPKLTRWFLTQALEVVGDEFTARDLMRTHQIDHRYPVAFLQQREDLLLQFGQLEKDLFVDDIVQWLYQADQCFDGDSYTGD